MGYKSFLLEHSGHRPKRTFQLRELKTTGLQQTTEASLLHICEAPGSQQQYTKL